ncbi:FecR domain-containing protein [Chitinophaga lutea]
MSNSTEHEQLLQQYLDGKCTPEEAARLMSWLQSEGAHRDLLRKMQEEFPADTEGEQPVIPVAVSDRIEARLLQAISSGKVVRMRRRWIAAAAVLLLAATAALWHYRMSPRPQQSAPLAHSAKPGPILPGSSKAILTLADGSTVALDSAGRRTIQQGQTMVRLQQGQLQYNAGGEAPAAGFNVLTVPRGGQFSIVLPDGSRAWLNSASKLRFPTAFNEARRVVELEGQGYFEISKDAAHPFIVRTAAVDVEVLGTAFDVMAYPDEKHVNATLVEGAVKVREHRLKPGQQAQLEHATGAVTIRAADVQQVIAWKTGFFEFDNANIAEIMRQVERWYDIEVTLSNTGGAREYGGRISRGLPLPDLLRMLEASGAKFRLQGRKLYVE